MISITTENYHMETEPNGDVRITSTARLKDRWFDPVGAPEDLSSITVRRIDFLKMAMRIMEEKKP